ncbi:MAG: primosomal protein N', partial [Bacteroidota bacterium]|nr:primosomal protein N' [Bacteroidota bacterium]
MYVDVIVPLALPKILTYRCDDHESIQTGLRVIVQVAKKQYTGIVYTTNQKRPSYKTKPIVAVLDEKPILQTEQLQLWSWISRYYMCSLGELMIAGIPNALKLQSDTYYITSCNFEEEDLSTYKENEQIILEALHHNNRLSLAEIIDILKVKYPHPYLKSLLNKGKITLYEELSDGYAEKKISKINLSPKLKEDDESMKQAFDQLTRAPKQEALFLHFLHRFQD